MNPEAIKKITDACLSGAAGFDANTVWWEMFWNAAGVAAIFAVFFTSVGVTILGVRRMVE